jgi:hypothetical protein
LDFAETSAAEAPRDNDEGDDKDEDEDEDDEGDDGDEDVGTVCLLAGVVATRLGCGEGTKRQIRHHAAQSMHT